jgi:hypothetical protein
MPTDPISLLTRENLGQTSQETGGGNLTPSASHGFSSLGVALGGGGNEPQNDLAEEKGMLVGAQTASAMASARDRVNKARAAEQAAKQMESPEFQTVTGIPQEEATLGAAFARAQADPNKITEALLNIQHFTNRAKLAASQPNNPALGAAMSEHPEGVFPKAIGTAGSFESPQGYDPNNPTATNPVHISPQQSQMNEAQINQRNTAADKNERAPAAGNGKLQTGFQWDVDTDMNSPTYGHVKTNPDGTPRQVPNPTAGSGEGAYAKLYHENMVGSLSGATAEMKNWMDLGPKESVGLANAKGQHGLLGAVSTDMGRALSTEQQQELQKTLAGLDRFISTVENGGRPPPAGFVNSTGNQLTALPTDTVHARAYGLALARQNLEAQLPRMIQGSASPQLKKEFSDEITNLKNIVPFTPQDIRDWQRSPQKDQTIGDYVKSKNAAGAALPDDIRAILQKHGVALPGAK